MRVLVAAVGKPRDSALASSIAEYETRAARYWPLEVVVVKEGGGTRPPDEVVRIEGERLLQATRGAGLIVYNRKEGRALGEVTKFLVYNARKRQPGGDQAATYFERTECVAGVQDARFQQLMPDILHWLGITRIDRFFSMSNMKHDALTGSGIEIGERVPIPDYLIPPDASVEMEAKKAAGYFTPEGAKSADELSRVVGRDLKQF